MINYTRSSRKRANASTDAITKPVKRTRAHDGNKQVNYSDTDTTTPCDGARDARVSDCTTIEIEGQNVFVETPPRVVEKRGEVHSRRALRAAIGSREPIARADATRIETSDDDDAMLQANAKEDAELAHAPTFAERDPTAHPVANLANGDTNIRLNRLATLLR